LPSDRIASSETHRADEERQKPSGLLREDDGYNKEEEK